MLLKFYSVREFPSFISIITVLIILSVLETLGCNSGELSRSRVKLSVEDSPAFTEPATIDLTNQYETNPSSVNKKSAVETVEQAKARDLKTLLESYPDLETANILGYTVVEQNLVKEDPFNMGGMNIPSWYLTRKIRANERGEQLWREMKLPVRNEALPIGTKQFVAVSGITKQGDAQAIADFTYKWTPNELGRALDERTNEFKKLPEEVQSRLTQKKGLLHASESIDWSGERQGKAVFQKYDDGWRLVKIF